MIGRKPRYGENNVNAVAASVYRAFRPTVESRLLNAKYRLRSEARPSGGGERDYALLQALARGKHCVLDVGANVGLTALIMSEAMAADGHLIAFEASESGCYLIRDNAALNGLSGRIQVVNALIADQSGYTLDFFGDAASGSASIIPGYLAHHRPLCKVTLALDDFIAQARIRPELIKIDVEGAELKVITGLARTMRALRPLVFVELHTWGDVTVVSTAARLLSQMESLDYYMIYLRNRSIVTDAAVFADRGRCHVLLVPRELSSQDQLSGLDTSGL